MWLIVLFLMLTTGFSGAADLQTLPRNSRQCLLVTTESWSATRGQLMMFERAGKGPWHRRGSSFPVRVGEAGLAWGRGILNPPNGVGPRKVEGDNKAPAGIFSLGSAFGYASRPPSTHMPYLALSDKIVGVDDPQSRFYNQLVDVSTVGGRDWRHAEKMILGDDRYKWGIVVKHNMPPEKGAGSCIFLHVWKNPETTTTGCTAMPESALLGLLKWLDPARHPLLIQLPAPLYEELREPWHLPNKN